MEKICINPNNRYTVANKNSFFDPPKKALTIRTNDTILPQEAVDVLKAQVFFGQNLKFKKNQADKINQKAEITQEEKQELIDFIKKNRKDFEEHTANYIAKYATTKKHIELAKLLSTKKFTISESSKRNLSGFDIVDSLKACSTYDLAEVAYDIVSKTDMFLDEKIYEVLLYYKNNEPEKYEYIKNSPSLLQYENNFAGFFNSTDDILKSKPLSEFPDIEEKIKDGIANWQLLTTRSIVVNTIANTKRVAYTSIFLILCLL